MGEDVAGDGNLTVGIQGFLTTVDGSVVTVSGAVLVGGEHLVGGGIEDNAGDGLAPVDNANGNGIISGIMGEISGAVDGIDDPPDVLVMGGMLVEGLPGGAFLGDDAVVGEGIVDMSDDKVLAFAVKLGNDLIGPLDIDPGGEDLVSGVFAGDTSGLLGHLKHIFIDFVFFHSKDVLNNSGLEMNYFSVIV